MKPYLQAIATIIALVNPAVCVAIFLKSVGHLPTRAKVVQALKAVGAVFVILLVAARFGTAILNLFGVSLSAFSCAGGGILVWIGINMFATPHRPATAQDGPQAQDVTMTPLILFAASPGTITGAITVAAAHAHLAIPLTAIVAITVVCSILLIVLLVAAGVRRHRGREGLLRQMITSYMGLPWAFSLHSTV